MKKDNKQIKKALFVTEITVLSIFLAFCIFCIIAQIVLPNLGITVWIKENVWDISGTLVSLKSQVPVIIRCIIYVIIIYAVCRILRIIFKNKMTKSNRTKTVFTLLDGFVKYGGAIAISGVAGLGIGMALMAVVKGKKQKPEETNEEV